MPNHLYNIHLVKTTLHTASILVEAENHLKAIKLAEESTDQTMSKVIWTLRDTNISVEDVTHDDNT